MSSVFSFHTWFDADKIRLCWISEMYFPFLNCNGSHKTIAERQFAIQIFKKKKEKKGKERKNKGKNNLNANASALFDPSILILNSHWILLCNFSVLQRTKFLWIPTGWNPRYLSLYSWYFIFNVKNSINSTSHFTKCYVNVPKPPAPTLILSHFWLVYSMRTTATEIASEEKRKK